MKNFPLYILFLGLSFAVSALPVHAQEERILSFYGNMEVRPDASMAVTEEITVKASGDSIKRGIYRDFPTRYKDKYGNNYVVDFYVKEVLRDGIQENYFIKDLNNGRRVYIGKEDVFLKPGIYKYTIAYETGRQLGFFKDFDELYWNVTGNGWIFPIDKVSARVILPWGAKEKIISYAAYTGPIGSREESYSASFDYAGDIIFTATRPLGPQEGFTIAVSWPKGFVKEPGLREKAGYFARDNRGVLAGVAGLLIILFYYLIVWARFGKDPARGVIIPLFSPPEKLSPATVRYIAKMGFDNKSFSADIINMAVKGYITINEENNVYTLKRTKALESVLLAEEAAVARKLFGLRNEIKLKNDNHDRIRNAIIELQLKLKTSFEKIYFLTNSQYFIPGVIISIATLIVSSILGPAEKLPVAIFMCIWLTGWSIGVAVLLKGVVLFWKASRPGQALGMTLFAIPFLIGEIAGIVIFGFATSVFTVLILAAAVFMNLLFYHLLKKHTLAGRKIMDRIEGFKMYLSVAEKERLNVLNPPEKTPELFERFLPYALALDVEQAWAEQFSEVLKQASIESGQAYHPGWYSGTSGPVFSPSSFAGNLGNSFSNAVSSASVAPGSSSGSGGFSGGGGSSGGGGGGGGGGGW